MNEQRKTNLHEIQRDLELTQCRLRLAHLDIAELQQENKNLKDELKRLLRMIEDDDRKHRSITEYL